MTIIVLLILAAVAISLTIGNNGIFTRAGNATEKYEQARANEEDEMQKATNFIDDYLNGKYQDDKLPDFPSSDFTRVEGTDLTNGLVIEDKIGNQYVWIEVPKTSEVYPTAGLNITNFTEGEYTAIEEDLHTYADDYRHTFSEYIKGNPTDTWYSVAQSGIEEEEYYNLKKKMLKSIYENGGFWIGRYEAGIDTYRAESGEATVVPLSKANRYPYTNVTCSQAQILASSVDAGNCTSSLMFGIQWDLVLKYLETKGVSKSELITDSTSWGNCISRMYNINNELARYTIDGVDWPFAPYSKQENRLVLLTTGASDEFRKMNIYDLSGNVFEWTLEYSGETRWPCGLRGNAGNTDEPVSMRSCTATSVSVVQDGFRVTLF